MFIFVGRCARFHDIHNPIKWINFYCSPVGSDMSSKLRGQGKIGRQDVMGMSEVSKVPKLS